LISSAAILIALSASGAWMRPKTWPRLRRRMIRHVARGFGFFIAMPRAYGQGGVRGKIAPLLHGNGAVKLPADLPPRSSASPIRPEASSSNCAHV
jgi:hypothetical protein